MGIRKARIGTNETGKTTATKEEVKDRERVFIIDPFGTNDNLAEFQPWPSEYPYKWLPHVEEGCVRLVVNRYRTEDVRALWEALLQVEKSVIWVDEARAISGIMDEDAEAILQASSEAQNDNDIILCAHSPDRLTKGFFPNLDLIEIRRTTAPVDSLKSRVQDPENLKAAIQYVNEQSEQDPYFYVEYDLSNPKTYKNGRKKSR